MSRRVGNQPEVPETESVRRRAEGPVSQTVVRAIAEARGTSPLALPPLADVLDPDALDALYAEERAASHVTFDYAGYSVSVAPDRTVTVTTAGTGTRDVAPDPR